jgi:hypothetical protein
MKHTAGYALISLPQVGRAPDPPQPVNHSPNAFIYSWNEALHVPTRPLATSLPEGKKK